MHIAIIGNGIAGITAAQTIRRHHPDWRISIISGESRFHYSRPALMYVYMGHMRYQDTKPYEDGYWDEQRFELIRDWVIAIDTSAKRLSLHSSGTLEYDKLLVATGSKSNKFGWPGQDLDGAQGLYGLMDLRLLYENTRHARQAVIVGGGLIGIELAEMLHSQGIEVTFLVREESYWDNIMPKEESAMLNRLIEDEGLGLRLSTQLATIVDDGHGRVGAVCTDKGEVLECQVVGLTAGVSPNIALLEGTDIEAGRGVLVDRSLRTSAEDVFAAGDCAEIRSEDGVRNLIQQVWYTGRRQGELVGDVISGFDRSYDPGIWYNSAKFFDLEYQVYGQVNMGVPGEQNLFWEHEDHRHSVRIVHVDARVIGFNFTGIRYRQEVCQRWIAQRRGVDYVLDHLSEGNFDPEFFRRYEPEIVGTLRGMLDGAGAVA